MKDKEYGENYYKNALTLAYLGDSVFSLMVRKHLILTYGEKPNGLNKRANAVVCARTQAEIMRDIKDTLIEDEIDVVMRARNAHTNNKAKNSTLEEYSLATQFEALVGYWYLNNDTKKLEKMFEKYVVERL
ncbi:MAG: ribonuclease III [Clostridiales bacterium]|nr:ribonuclease III [Clostridiales bacterium]